MLRVVAEPEPVWCVVANVRAEAYGNATSVGTKHFKGGALLWILHAYWWDGLEGLRVSVIGRHRVSKRWTALVEQAERLTNWRAMPAYHPAVIARLRRWRDPWGPKEDCERAAHWLDVSHPAVPDLRGEIERRKLALSLLDGDPQGRTLDRLATAALGRWTQRQRQADRTPVLSDWLEDRGASVPLAELIRTLDRRRAL